MNVLEFSTGTILELRDLCGLFIAYRADGYTLAAGVTAIFSLPCDVPAGILLFSPHTDCDGKPCFMVANMQNARNSLLVGRVYPPEQAHARRRELLEEALVQIEGTPLFLHNDSQHIVCPLPNFMKSEQWPQIARALRNCLEQLAL